MTCAEFAARVEDYVTGDLAAAERSVLEAHAATCSDCRGTLRALEETTALLWLALPQIDPPSSLRARILGAARAMSPDSPAAPVAFPPRRPRPIWRLPLPGLAAALGLLSLLLALGLGAWVAALQAETTRLAAQNARLSEQISRQRDALYVLMSPTRQERPLVGGEAAPRARGLVYLDHARGQGMIIASELPPAAADKSYQVWLRGQAGVVSVGLLRVDERGTGYAVIESPTPLGQFEGIGISLEPAGGSLQPTGPRMLGGSL